MRRTRKPTVALALAAALLGGVAASAQEAAQEAAQKDEVVARLGDREITSADVAVAADDLRETLQQLPADQREAYLLTYLADLDRIARAAEAEGVQDSDAFKAQFDYMRDRTLMEVYLTRLGDEAATDEAARALYDKTVSEAPAEEEVKASHILVESEEEAKEVKQELDAGGDFADLAEGHSKDPGSASKGGDLGYFGKEQMVPEFSEVAFSLEPGQVSDPVKSQFGWHIIKVEDKREKEKPTYESVEGQLKSVLARQAQRDKIMALREETPVELNEQDGADLGEEAAGTPAEGEQAPPAASEERPAAQ